MRHRKTVLVVLVIAFVMEFFSYAVPPFSVRGYSTCGLNGHRMTLYQSITKHFFGFGAEYDPFGYCLW
jgi:hypothetical protein